MEKTMRMPASYNVMTHDEMTYTSGGATGVGGALASIASIAVSALSIYNYVVGLSEGRKWYAAHRSMTLPNMASAAMDDLVKYGNQSIFHAIRGIFTVAQMAALWPITGIALLTA